MLDVSQDLNLTDDSDHETAPEKKTRKTRSKTDKRARDTNESRNFEGVAKFPLTPRLENQMVDKDNKEKVDVSSPRGISELLKSSLVSHSLLSSPTSRSSPTYRTDENSVSPAVKRKKKRPQLSRSSTETH